MSLKKVVLSEDLTPLLLGEVPGFRTFWKEIVNPLAGTRKRRLLHDPNEAMRIIHGRTVSALRAVKFHMPHATACRPGDSPVKNVARHRGNRYFVLYDLANAFTSVDLETLAGVLCFIDPELEGYEKDVKDFLSRNVTSPLVGGVAQGAPASPDLFNIYCTLLIDHALGVLCEEEKLTYTRYLDDITISGRRPIRLELRRKVRGIIQAAGFQIKDRKAKVQQLRRGRSIIITGVALTSTGEIFVPRSYSKYVEELLREGVEGNFTLLPKISGAMGIFRSITNRTHPNSKQEKILNLHNAFKRRVRGRWASPVL